VPRRKAVASKRTVMARTRYWSKLIGLDWKLHVEFCDDEHPPDKDDLDCYCCLEPQPQYKRAILSIHRTHPAWETCLRHELGHAVVSPLAQFAMHLVEKFVSDTKVRAAMVAQLNDAEDQTVTWFAEMPGWEVHEDDE
jgi:hypothetical protein